MKLTEILLKEMELEASTTRKMLAIVPMDKLDWKPHEKSMNIQTLATHVAEILGMVKTVLNTNEFDFEKEPYNPTVVKNNVKLLACFEKNTQDCRESLTMAHEENLWLNWTMRSGESVFMTSSKYEAIRHMFCQVVHHRAQLGVFLRLLNIPIPGSYGPSADEMS